MRHKIMNIEGFEFKCSNKMMIIIKIDGEKSQMEILKIKGNKG